MGSRTPQEQVTCHKLSVAMSQVDEGDSDTGHWLNGNQQLYELPNFFFC